MYWAGARKAPVKVRPTTRLTAAIAKLRFINMVLSTPLASSVMAGAHRPHGIREAVASMSDAGTGLGVMAVVNNASSGSAPDRLIRIRRRESPRATLLLTVPTGHRRRCAASSWVSPAR